MLQVRTADNESETLDNFVVNDGGTALVCSQTGNEIGKDAATLSYSGGSLNDVEGDLQFRFISDFTSSNEVVRLDNFEITQTTADDFGDDDRPDDSKGGQYDVQYIAGIPVLKPVDEDPLKAAINEVDGDDEDDPAV